MALSVSLALDTVLFVLALAVRCGVPLSRVVSHQSDEIVLLTVFGAVLLSPGLRIGSKCGPLSEHSWWASPSQDPRLNKRIVCSRPCDPIGYAFGSATIAFLELQKLAHAFWIRLRHT